MSKLTKERLTGAKDLMQHVGKNVCGNTKGLISVLTKPCSCVGIGNGFVD